MELFSALGINWKILLGELINFAILLYLLKKFVYPKILEVLEKRKTKIEKGLKRAEELECEFEKIKKEREEIINKANDEARKILEEANRLKKEKEEKVLKWAEEYKENLIKEAKESAQREAEKIIEGAKKEIVKNTLLIAEKFLAEKIDEEKDRRFIESLINKTLIKG